MDFKVGDKIYFLIPDPVAGLPMEVYGVIESISHNGKYATVAEDSDTIVAPIRHEFVDLGAARILSYLRGHGFDILPYVDGYSHVTPGTLSVVTIRMWGMFSGGRYGDWVKLMDILNAPGCPIRMEPIESHPYERKRAFDRLVWKEK